MPFHGIYRRLRIRSPVGEGVAVTDYEFMETRTIEFADQRA